MNVAAVILAGGESRRMGRDKAWVEWGGVPLVQLAVEKVRAVGVEEIMVSGRAGQDYSALRCPVLFDRTPGFGPLGGIEQGLHQCVAPLLLVFAVDLPRMSVNFLRKLVERSNRLTGVVPRLNGALEPLAAIYPKSCHALALAALAGTRRAARDFAEACLTARAVRTLAVTRREADNFRNWNRPSDIAAASDPASRCHVLAGDGKSVTTRGAANPRGAQPDPAER